MSNISLNFDTRGTKRKQNANEPLVVDQLNKRRRGGPHPSDNNHSNNLMSTPTTPTTPLTPSKFGAFGANKSAAKKTINIKPLKVKPTIPEDFEEKTWQKLQASVKAVFAKNNDVGSSQEELYKGVVDLCNHKKEEKLFENLRAECEQHVQVVLQKLQSVQAPDYASYLAYVVGTWEDYQNQMLTIRSIFLYLDRSYIMPKTSARSLWEFALYLFRKYVIMQVEVQGKIIAGLLHLIERERKGDFIERSMIKTILRMLSALQVYEEIFEKICLNKSKEFYDIEGRHLMEDLNVPEYLKHVETRLAQENERAIAYLAQSTKRPLLSTVEKQLIEQHAKTLVTKGFSDLISNLRFDDLYRMYNLINNSNQLDILRDAFGEYVRTAAMAIVSDEEKDKSMVDEMLEFKEKMDQVLTKSFKNNETFKFTMRGSFEKALNSRQNKPAELIAKFIHSKLQAGTKSASDDALEKSMDDALILFRFIDGKDVFEGFYKKDLAKRLLLGRSSSIDAEKTMITKLKSECGSQFTNKLEGMLKDIDLSKDIMAQFSQSKEYDKVKKAEVDMNVTIVTSGFWPQYTPSPVTLPLNLQSCMDIFTHFYVDKHASRILKWQHSLAQCSMRASFPRGKKELQVSLFQAIVLLQFNNCDKMTFDELKATTGVEEKELKRTLQSLALGKFKVLLKLEDSKDVNNTDSFFYNQDFDNPMYRIRINNVQMKETAEEQTQTTEKVLVERQYQIDAAVVRIMKARKQLNHQELIREVLAQWRIPTNVQDIKKRIESLIDRDYLERETTSDKQTIYKYLA